MSITNVIPIELIELIKILRAVDGGSFAVLKSQSVVFLFSEDNASFIIMIQIIKPIIAPIGTISNELPRILPINIVPPQLTTHQEKAIRRAKRKFILKNE